MLLTVSHDTPCGAHGLWLSYVIKLLVLRHNTRAACTRKARHRQS